MEPRSDNHVADNGERGSRFIRPGTEFYPAQYGRANSDSMEVDPSSCNHFTCYVLHPNGQIYQFEVKYMTTVGELKQKVAQHLGLNQHFALVQNFIGAPDYQKIDSLFPYYTIMPVTNAFAACNSKFKLISSQEN